LALKILRQVYTAMADQGTLLLIEHVIEADNQPGLGKLLDINMLAMTEGGKERTRHEYETLLAEAGFQLIQIVPTASGVCVIEGKKR
jgi:hypothetical protein